MIKDSVGLAAEAVRDVLAAGCRAPSVHNTQPWLFRVQEDRLEVLADQTRRLGVCDPDGREFRLAIGAAVFNIRMGLLAHGVRPLVTVRPNDSPGVEAVIRNGGVTHLNEETEPLYRAIPQRRTNRRPFTPDRVPAGHRYALVRAAGTELCWLQSVDEPAQRDRLHTLAVTAHRAQQRDPAWHAEFARWTGREGTADGVPLSAAGPEPEDTDRWVLRDFGASRAAHRRADKDFEQEPLLMVLASHFEGAFAQVQAGQALQRVLLSAEALGLSVSFLSQLIEVPGVRGELQRLIGGSVYPQAVLRVGFGSPVAATPRRSPEECTLLDDGRSIVGTSGAA